MKTGILKLEELTVGMIARIIHPEYANEYPEDVEIVCIDKDSGENVTILDCGYRYDGWKAKDLLIIGMSPAMIIMPEWIHNQDEQVKLLEKYGWEVECFSPFESRHVESESFVKGKHANEILIRGLQTGDFDDEL